jgi:hypothetical protein
MNCDLQLTGACAQVRWSHAAWPNWERSKVPGPIFEAQSGGGGCLQVSEKRRNSAALQDAGAIYSVPVGSTSAFGPKQRRDMQVVDISSKTAKNRFVSRLISRRLGRKPRVFDPFLTRKGVDFSAVTEILPDFFAGEACAQYLRGNLFLATGTKVAKSSEPASSEYRATDKSA